MSLAKRTLMRHAKTYLINKHWPRRWQRSYKRRALEVSQDYC